MNRAQTFSEFVATQNLEIPLWNFGVNLLLAAFLAYLLGRLYIHFGSSLSNRTVFAHNFVLLAMTTMLVITIVKSSLALSLGLVGALSIVRFRAAIKEPEELSYLFFAIAIGLGFGANQRIITLMAFIIVFAVILLRHRTRRRREDENLFLTVRGVKNGRLRLGTVVEQINGFCSDAHLKRFDSTGDTFEAAFLVNLKGYEQLEQLTQALEKLDDRLAVTYMGHSLGG